jgi:hypothetical protein
MGDIIDFLTHNRIEVCQVDGIGPVDYPGMEQPTGPILATWLTLGGLLGNPLTYRGLHIRDQFTTVNPGGFNFVA